MMSAEQLGLGVGQTRSRFVEQHQLRLADDGSGHLDESPFLYPEGTNQSCATSVSPTKSRASSTAAVRPALPLVSECSYTVATFSNTVSFSIACSV